MSVISDMLVTPNRIHIVWSYLNDKAYKPSPKEELAHVLYPSSLTPGENQPTNIPDSVIQAMLDFKLIEEDSDTHSIKLASTAPVDEPELLEYLERCLLGPGEAEKYENDKVPQALAWFLTNDPLNPLGFSTDPTTHPEQTTLKEVEITNQQRFQQLGYWANYLGLGWFYGTEHRSFLVPDPMVAINRNLPKIMKEGETLPMEQFLSELGHRLSVLEQGNVRKEFQETYQNENQNSNERQLCRATSFALERLQRLGVLKIAEQSDATGWTLDNGSASPRTVTHVTFTGGVSP